MNDQFLYLRRNMLAESIRFLVEVATTDPIYNNVDGILLEQRTVDNDDLLECMSSSSKKWNQLDLLQCDGPKLDNLVKFALRKLECLALRRLNEGTVEDVFTVLSTVGLRDLQTLRLHVSRFNESLATLLAKALVNDSGCSLKELFLQNSRFDDMAAILSLAHGLQSNLSIISIDISSCQLRDSHVKILLSSLPPTLKKLDMQDNYCRSDGMAALVALLLKPSRNIQSVNLTNQHPGEFGGGLDLSLLGLSIPSNASLRQLDLSFNMLTTSDIGSLIAALSKNKDLETLNLSSNRLDDQTMHLIGNYMGRMEGLQKLSVVANKFGETGANALRQGLRKNGRIVQLSMLRGFSASEDIDYLLAYNRAGRRLLIENTTKCIPLGLWPLIFERINTQFDEATVERASAMSYMIKGYMFHEK
jgi:Ran GTPase-activating protein (RanGAP) involved in mRNA processing and transport